MARPQKPNNQTVQLALLGLLPESEKIKLDANLWPILNKMLLLYYPPFIAETEEELEEQVLSALEDYIEDLIEFDADVLAKGWRDVRRSHKVQRWPTSGAMRDACLLYAGSRAKQDPRRWMDRLRQGGISNDFIIGWLRNTQYDPVAQVLYVPKRIVADWMLGHKAHEFQRMQEILGHKLSVQVDTSLDNGGRAA